MVQRQTSDTAGLYGLGDRGALTPGLMADVNVIDLENLRLHTSKVSFDLPAGGRRMLRGSTVTWPP